MTQKQQCLSIVLTAEEKKRIVEEAKKLGVGQSEFVLGLVAMWSEYQYQKEKR